MHVFRIIGWLLPACLSACGEPGMTPGAADLPPSGDERGCQSFGNEVVVRDVPLGETYRIAALANSYLVAWHTNTRDVPREVNFHLFGLGGEAVTTNPVTIPHGEVDLNFVIAGKDGRYYVQTVESVAGRPLYWLHALSPEDTTSIVSAPLTENMNVSGMAVSPWGLLAVSGSSTAEESSYAVSTVDEKATLTHFAEIREAGTTCPVVSAVAASHNQLAIAAVRETTRGTRKLSVIIRSADGSVNDVLIEEHQRVALEEAFYCASYAVYIKKLFALPDGSFGVWWWDYRVAGYYLTVVSNTGVAGPARRIKPVQFPGISDLAWVEGDFVASVYQYNGRPDEVGILRLQLDLEVETSDYLKLGIDSWEAPKIASTGRHLAVVRNSLESPAVYFLACR